MNSKFNNNRIDFEHLVYYAHFDPAKVVHFVRLIHKEAPLPFIAHWNNSHFIVVYKIKNDEVFISDPSYGLISYPKKEFIARWIGNNATDQTNEGIALLLETTPKFKKLKTTPKFKKLKWEETDKKSFKFLYQYLFKYQSLLVQLVIGLLVGSLLQLIVPFLTQSIVDVGIQNQDINFIYH